MSNSDRNPKRQRLPKDETVIIELLAGLPSKDRQALLRFFVDGQPKEVIESSFGIDGERFRELRRSVEAAFFERTGRLY